MSLKNNDLGGILYLIGKGGEKGFPFRIRLQKMVLLAKLEESFPFSFEYESYPYGPYSTKLHHNLIELISRNFVNEKVVISGDDSSGFVYTLTSEGVKELNRLSLSDVDKGKIDSLWLKYSQKTTTFVIRKAKEISGIKSISD